MSFALSRCIWLIPQGANLIVKTLLHILTLQKLCYIQLTYILPNLSMFDYLCYICVCGVCVCVCVCLSVCLYMCVCV